MVTSNIKTGEILNRANQNTEMLNKIARQLWISKAHKNCDIYFDLKFMNLAKEVELETLQVSS